MVTLLLSLVCKVAISDSDVNDPCDPANYPYKMVNMTTDEMARWYSPFDICVLTNYNQVERCPMPPQRECSVTIGYLRLPSVLYQQPVHVVTGEPLKRASILDFLRDLDRRAQTLVVVGDSISREHIHSLFCALKFENERASIYPALTKALFGVVEFVFTVPAAPGVATPDEKFKVVYFSVAGRFACSSFGWVATELNNTVYKADRSAVLMFNMGLHEKDNGAYTGQLGCILRWAEGGAFGTMPGKSNIFAYRETSAQNYPDSVGGEIDFARRRQWLSGELPSPVCTSYLCDARVSSVTSRLEIELGLLSENHERVARQEQDGSGAGAVAHIHHIPYKHHSRRFWELHPASGLLNMGNGPHRASAATDCTHSKVNPMQYQPVWNVLADIVGGQKGPGQGGRI